MSAVTVEVIKYSQTQTRTHPDVAGSAAYVMVYAKEIFSDCGGGRLCYYHQPVYVTSFQANVS